MGDLAGSDVVGSWEPPFRNLCRPTPPEPCDCGFVGRWDRRWVYTWYHKAGHQRGDKAIRRDIARGLPARAHDEGWWVIDGWDERCPGCGDIDRFDHDANLVGRLVEQAKVVV